MERNKQISVRRPTGGLDRDSENSKVAPENYRYALNMDSGYGVSVNGMVPHDGTIEIPYSDFPDGSEYEVIGAYEDRQRESILYFLYDTTPNTVHLILEFTRDGDIKELLRGQFLNFSRSAYVHSCSFVDGIAYWTDGWDYENVALGNPPRMMDTDRFRPDKRITYRAIFNTDCFFAGTEFRYELYSLNASPTGSSTLFLTLPADADPEDAMLAIFNAMDTAGFDVTPFAINTADNPATYIDFYWPSNNIRIKIYVSGPTGSPDVELHETNFYPSPSEVDNFENQLTIIKPTPPFAPVVQFEKDAAIPAGTIGKYALKFRYRYHFVDGEKSAWGPYSIVPTNYSGDDPHLPYNDRLFNKVRITFDDNDFYLQEGWRHLVKKVEVGVFSSANSILTRVGIYDLDDFYLDRRVIEYTGSTIYPAVPSDENADPDVQALKNFDDVPKIALGLESVYDESGNTLLLLGAGQFDYDIPFEPTLSVSLVEEQLTDPLPAPQVSQNKGLKRGGRYRVGIIFKDAYGRHSDVLKYHEISVPWSKFVNPVGNTYWTAYHLRTNFLTAIPTWADYYQIVITENLNQDTYFQAITKRAVFLEFATAADGTKTVVFGGVAGTDKSYTGFHIISPDEINAIEDNLGQLTLFETENEVNYEFLPVEGDRLHVQYWEGTFTSPPFGDSPIAGNVEDYNYRVAGYLIFTPPARPDVTEYFILIENDDSVPRFDFYNAVDPVEFHLEVYRPKVSPVEDVFYEFGETQRITSGITTRDVTHSWYGDTFISCWKKTPAALKDLVTGYEEVNFPAVEQRTLDKTDDIPVNDLGRAVAFNENYKQVYRRNVIKYSDTTQPDSEIRGASSFRGTSNIRVSDKWGPVRKLVFNQNVLLAIMSTKTQPIYVAKDRLMDLSGASFVGRADSVFNIADEVMMDLGTYFPESVVYEQGQTFGFDLATGRMWRYTTGGGQVPISDRGVISTFQGIANDSSMANLNGVHVVSGYRRSTETLYVRFGSTVITFKNKENRWASFLTMTFEQMVSNKLDTFVFKEGNLYLITGAVDKANYFGLQGETQVDFIFNDQIDIMKVFDSMEINSTNQWFLYYIDVFPSPNYPSGMQSTIPDNLWTNYEGRRKADFLRDELDPSYEFAIIEDPGVRRVTARLRGRVLRGDMARIRIRQSTPGSSGAIRGIYVNWVPSETIIKQ